jgi:hypothetical protein
MTLELKLDALVWALERRYRPDQPRAPKGTPEGGQWIRDGGRRRRNRIRTALSAVLKSDRRIGIGDGILVRHCLYEDMLGRQFTKEIVATKPCPPTIPTPPYWGPF